MHEHNIKSAKLIAHGRIGKQ